MTGSTCLCHINIRKQVLATRGLGFEDFKDVPEAISAADQIIKQFQSRYPEKVTAHPDWIYTGLPQLDQFWFAEYKGILGELVCLFVLRGAPPPFLCTVVL